jgi:hypothetical protein
MAALISWFYREGQRICARRSGGFERLVLALEILEPRHLLAADGFGMMDVLDVAWQPEVPVEEGPAALPTTGCGARLSHFQGGLAHGDSPEIIHLDQVAAELGEVIELDGSDSLWHDDDWYDPGSA